MSDNKRKLEWDFAKALLMILVIFGHVCPAISGPEYNIKWNGVTRVTSLFVMPLFFFISGYFQSSIHNIGVLLRKYWKTVKRLVVPLLVWGVVRLFFINNLVPEDVANYPIWTKTIVYFKYFIGSTLSYYWFFPSLCLCIFLGSILSLMVNRNSLWGIVIIVVSSVLPIFLPKDVLHFSFIWFFYAFGMLYRVNEDRIVGYLKPKIDKGKKYFSILVVVVTILIVFMGTSFYPEVTFYKKSNLVYDTSILFILKRYVVYFTASLIALYWIFKLYQWTNSKKLTIRLADTGKDTLFLYCSHVLILSYLLSPFIKELTNNQGIVTNLPILSCSLIAIPLSILLYSLLEYICLKMKNIRVLRVLLMGLE